MDLGIGFGEVLVVLVVVFIIWGPGRMPEIARTLGKTMRALRKSSYDFTSAITREIEMEEGKTKHPDKARKQTHLPPSRLRGNTPEKQENTEEQGGDSAAK